MKIGIGLPNQIRNVRPAVIPDWAELAEGAGFATLATIGRIAYPGVMDTVALAAAAGATRRIGLFTNVLIGPAWPPVLLAKEVAAIDGVSSGRLRLGLGIGVRPDDFVAGGLSVRGRGDRIDQDLQTYHSVWGGELVGGINPAVPEGGRPVPLYFGGSSARTFRRLALWGEGYVALPTPAEAAESRFRAARAAWEEAGRRGAVRLVATAYFALGDPERGRANIFDYFRLAGRTAAAAIVDNIADTPDIITEVVKKFEEIGADELIFQPTIDDPGEVHRLADAIRQPFAEPKSLSLSLTSGDDSR